jgi:hypothetical protein
MNALGVRGIWACVGTDRLFRLLWPLKINHAGLMPRALDERKAGLEVRRTRSQIISLYPLVRVRGGERFNECLGRERDMGLCWDRPVVQTFVALEN